MSFLEQCWEEREEHRFVEIFGDTGPGIYPLSTSSFVQMNVTDIDPRWLSFGVFKCPSTQNRSSWVYVTSGMSNPWETEEPREYSGMGVEFILETYQEEQWGIELLHTLMAYNLSLASGQLGELPPIGYGACVPLSLSDLITAMLFARPAHFPVEFELQSGKVELLQVLGITQAERDFVNQNSSELFLQDVYKKAGSLITSKNRSGIV